MAAQSEAVAKKKVDKHVSPKECFVWYMDSKRGYEPIPGTGCAHWVAHEKGWKGGKPGRNGCDKKYLTRVKDVLGKAGAEVQPGDAKPGYLFVKSNRKHCGLVRKVAAGKEPGGPPIITIEHCSTGLGRVGKSDWGKYFKGTGTFHKA